MNKEQRKKKTTAQNRAVVSSQQSSDSKPGRDSKKQAAASVKQSDTTGNGTETVGANDQAVSRMMSECSSAAQALRKSITERLESFSTPPAHCSETQTLDDTNSHVKEILEKSIREKLSDLEQALKQDCVTTETPVVCPAPPVVTNHTATTDCDSLPELQQTPQIAPQVDIVMECGETADQTVAKEDTVGGETGQTGVQKLSLVKKAAKNSPTKRSGPKDRLTTEHVIKGLNGTTDSEKLQSLAGKHVELFEISRSSELHVRQQEKAIQQLIREKEQLQSDHNRTVLAKSRLENLCRELQRQNKAVKEESLSRIKEEEDRRREIATKFQTTLNEIMQLVQENQEKNIQLKDENSELAAKLKLLMDHYEIWEKNVEKIVQKKDLEGQLLAAQMAQSQILFTQEKEVLLREKQQLFERLAELQRKGIEMNQKEMQLTSELEIYTSKYQEFQDVVTKSNSTFSGLKKDMEKMSSQIKKLEKEAIQWRNKFENCNRSLATVSADKQTREEELGVALQKVDRLEKLCRALQLSRGQETPATTNSNDKQ